MAERLIGCVGDMRAALDGYEDHAPILVQVVATDGSVFHVALDFAHGRDCGFQWPTNPLILSARHPMLAHLVSSEDRSAPPPPGAQP